MNSSAIRKQLLETLAKRMMNQYQIALPNNPFAYDIKLTDSTASITGKKLLLEANFVKDADGDYCLCEIFWDHQRYL